MESIKASSAVFSIDKFIQENENGDISVYNAVMRNNDTPFKKAITDFINENKDIKNRVLFINYFNKTGSNLNILRAFWLYVFSVIGEANVDRIILNTNVESVRESFDAAKAKVVDLAWMIWML